MCHSRVQREAAKSPFQEEEWERRLADKALAYNLLHADFIVKMHDLDAIREANARLQEKVRGRCQGGRGRGGCTAGVRDVAFGRRGLDCVGVGRGRTSGWRLVLLRRLDPLRTAVDCG